MKKLAIALAAFAVVGIAHATCPDGSMHEDHYYNDCSKALKNTGGTTNNGGGGGGGGAGVGVGLGIAGAAAGAVSDATGGNAASVANGGTALSNSAGGAGGSATGGTGGTSAASINGLTTAQQQAQQQQSRSAAQANGTVSGVATGGASVDNRTANSTSYSSNDRVWANPVIHAAAGPALAPANMAIIPGRCGPRAMIVTKPVIGVRFGVWGGQQEVIQGETDRLMPLTDGNGNPVEPFDKRGDFYIGHIATKMAAVVGTSSSGSFSIGGFTNNGGGAQGGGSASGQIQQIVTRYDIEECVYAGVPRPEEVIVYLPGPVQSCAPIALPPKPIFRKKVVRKAPVDICVKK